MGLKLGQKSNIKKKTTRLPLVCAFSKLLHLQSNFEKETEEQI